MDIKLLHEADMRRKNKLVGTVLVFASTLGLATQIVFHVAGLSLLSMVAGFLLSCSILYLHKRGKGTEITPYLALMGLSLVTLTFMASGAYTINTLMLYVIVAVASVYMRKTMRRASNP